MMQDSLIWQLFNYGHVKATSLPSLIVLYLYVTHHLYSLSPDLHDGARGGY